MPLKHPNLAELPSGFVLDPPPSSPPHRNAAPQRRALMGPDYGQNFLRQSLGGSPPEQWRQAEAPKLADRMRQARSLWSQRLAIERERYLAEIESAYMKPEEAPLSLRPIIPKSSRTRNRRLADVREQLNQQRDLIAKEALNLSISPQNDFERKYSAASGLREKATAIAADPAGAMGALSPSLMAATPEMALQLTLARRGRSIDKGVAAVSGIGFGTKSAYDQEYAAELIHSLARQGVDVRSKQSLQRAMSDAGVMATARSEARRKASIVAAGGGLGGALGTRMLAPSSLPPLGREFANLAAQLPAQTLISSITEAASQWAARGKIEGGDVLLSVLGGLAGAPGQIAEAKIGGYRQANPAARDAARIQARQGSDGVGTSENPVGADWKEVIATAIGSSMPIPLDVASSGASGYRQKRNKFSDKSPDVPAHISSDEVRAPASIDSSSMVEGTPKDSMSDGALSDMYKLAPAAESEINAVSERIVSKVGGLVSYGGIKSRGRALDKALTRYRGDVSRIDDLVRNTIIVRAEDVFLVISELEKLGANIRRIFPQENRLGYGDIRANLKTKEGIIGEIQVVSPEMLYAKEVDVTARAILGDEAYNAIGKRVGMPGGLGRQFYEDRRKIKGNGAAAKEIERKSREYYDAIRRSEGIRGEPTLDHRVSKEVTEIDAGRGKNERH